MSITDTTENALLDLLFNGVAYTAPATITVALHTADPGETGSTANEVTGGSYARKTATFAAAASGQVANDADIVWTGMPGPITVTHVSLWNGATPLWTGPLAAAKTLDAGDTFQLLTGQLTVSLD